MSDKIDVMVQGIANWTRLWTPHEDMEGGMIRSMELVVPKEVAQEWVDKKYQKTLKTNKQGEYILKLKKAAVSSEGEPIDPPKVFEADGHTKITSPIVGNGSKVTVLLTGFPYDNKFGKGVSMHINKVRVDDLVRYEVNDTFDGSPVPDDSFDTPVVGVDPAVQDMPVL